MIPEQRLDGLNTRLMGQTAVYLPSVNSTNTYLFDHPELPEGTLCYTGWQQAGRGRRGHQWECENGEALAMSVLLHQAENLPILPLAAGLAVSLALEKLTGQAFQLKWPNDSICDGHKICGILCESQMQGARRESVIGIGINLRQPPEVFAARGLPFAASVKTMTGLELPLGTVAAAVLNELEPLCDRVKEGGFAAIREAYVAHCANLNREVRVISGDKEITGKACDVAEDGSLVIMTGGKRMKLCAGEVSVRGLYGYV